MRGDAARPTSPGPAAASRVRTVSAAATAIAAKRTDGRTAGRARPPTAAGGTRRRGRERPLGTPGQPQGAEGPSAARGAPRVCAFPNCQCIKSVTNAAAPGRVCQRLSPGIAAQCNNERKAGAPPPMPCVLPGSGCGFGCPTRARGSQKQRPGWAPCRFSSRGAGRARAAPPTQPNAARAGQLPLPPPS